MVDSDRVSEARDRSLPCLAGNFNRNLHQKVKANVVDCTLHDYMNGKWRAKNTML